MEVPLCGWIMFAVTMFICSLPACYYITCWILGIPTRPRGIPPRPPKPMGWDEQGEVGKEGISSLTYEEKDGTKWQ